MGRGGGRRGGGGGGVGEKPVNNKSFNNLYLPDLNFFGIIFLSQSMNAKVLATSRHFTTENLRKVLLISSVCFEVCKKITPKGWAFL